MCRNGNGGEKRRKESQVSCGQRGIRGGEVEEGTGRECLGGKIAQIMEWGGIRGTKNEGSEMGKKWVVVDGGGDRRKKKSMNLTNPERSGWKTTSRMTNNELQSNCIRKKVTAKEQRHMTGKKETGIHYGLKTL